MKQLLIIPIRKELDRSFMLAEEYGAGFEYNDFFYSDVLDDEAGKEALIQMYLERKPPAYCTMHGAFFDVYIFSTDRKIREVSRLRIEQSLEIASKLEVKGIVFHSNFIPFLDSEPYISSWIKGNEALWSEMLERYGNMNIYIENMFDCTPYAMQSLSERLCRYDNYGVCFDYAHAALSGLSHEEWMGSLGKYIKHMHINDNNFLSDQHLAVGDGNIDWNEFYSLYEKYCPKATVLVETSSSERQERSLKKLKNDRFF